MSTLNVVHSLNQPINLSGITIEFPEHGESNQRSLGYKQVCYPGDIVKQSILRLVALGSLDLFK